jgi:hypothetical protein
MTTYPMPTGTRMTNPPQFTFRMSVSACDCEYILALLSLRRQMKTALGGERRGANLS